MNKNSNNSPRGSSPSFWQRFLGHAQRMSFLGVLVNGLFSIGDHRPMHPAVLLLTVMSTGLMWAAMGQAYERHFKDGDQAGGHSANESLDRRA